MNRTLLSFVVVPFLLQPAIPAVADLVQDDVDLAAVRMWPLAAAKLKYAEIIEQTHNDRTSNSTLRVACRDLATRVFREECEDYGYTCPPTGADIWKWPADIDENVVAELKANIPALRHCSKVYLVEVPLPIRRFPPRITCEMIENKASGWVVVNLSLDDHGNVSQASVSESTSKLLEDSAIEASRRFQYQKILGASGYLPETSVQAIIWFDHDFVQNSNSCEKAANSS